MNIQPVSFANLYTHSTDKVAFSSNKHSENRVAHKSNDESLRNALKALALASAIAFPTAGFVSCDKEIIDDCNHPNHVGIPINKDSTNFSTDTILTGIRYVIPSIEMPRYMVNGNDTTKFGKVSISTGVVSVPYNSHKSSELNTVMNFINTLGLKTKNLDNEYSSTRAFADNTIPAQLAWINEKNGTVNKVFFNGFDEGTGAAKMNLVSIPRDTVPVERELHLLTAGQNKLLINVFDKKGKELNPILLSLKNDTISQFNRSSNGKFVKAFEYSKNNGNSVVVTDTNGKHSKLANINIFTAISKEK